MMPPPSRRKKWTEAEERTLIDKYGEMVCDGTLAKMKTREKKYRPVAMFVNSTHHAIDPIAYPWQWTWKDVSTKVQNMRHQYSLVKQKIKKSEDFDWVEGLAHWSNFLRYKEVFGDVSLVFNSSNEAGVMLGAGENNENSMEFDGSVHGMEIVQFGHLGQAEDGDFTAGIDGGGGDENVMVLGFQYDGEGGEGNNYNDNNNDSHIKEDGDDGFVYEDADPTGSDVRRKKRKVLRGLEKKTWGFLTNQLRQLKDMETQFEQREAERERERQRREHLQREIEQEREQKWEEQEKAREKSRRQRIQEWETMEKESEERERVRIEEKLVYEKEWEERMIQRRSEWKKRIDDMLSQHREEIGQMQTRFLHEQQNLTGQLLSFVSQWTSPPTGLSDHTGATNHYVAQMMQNLHHVNGIVHEDSRVEGDNQDDQFIVDG